MRTLIEEVIADVDSVAGEIILQIHWKGGVHTELRLPRRRRGQMNHTSKDVVAAVRSLARICSDDVIAGVLNRNEPAHRSWQPLDARARGLAPGMERDPVLLARALYTGGLAQA